jgi:hypothetical protein
VIEQFAPPSIWSCRDEDNETGSICADFISLIIAAVLCCICDVMVCIADDEGEELQTDAVLGLILGSCGIG